MGIEFSHNAWTDGSAMAFNWWRVELAKAAGYPIGWDERWKEEIIPLDDPAYQAVFGDTDEFSTERFNRGWGWWFDELPDDPLMILLVWNTPGDLLPRYGNVLADRIEELIEKLPEDESVELGGWQERSRDFVAGLRQAAKADENLHVIR